MDKEIRVLEDLKNQIEKGRSNFKKSPKERITQTYIQARLDNLEEIYSKFNKKNEAIISNYSTKALEDTNYTRDDLYDTGTELYLIYKAELNAVFQNVTQSTETPSVTRQAVKLPQIQIPLFNGSYADWTSFKDLFRSLVHNNATLDNVQRLHYLKTLLRGEAEQLIKHIPVTETNYQKCWDMLQSRYDNKRFIANNVLKRFFSQRTMSCESAQLLKELLNTTSDCLHELTNLGINVTTWDIIIIYFVSLKLDPETRKQWELYVNSSGEDLPSFSQFKEFIECRFRALELVEPIKGKVKFSSNYTNPKVLHTTSDTSVICPHCQDNHKLYSCSKFAKESVSTRQDIVKSLRLCYNCLGSNHFGNTCRVKTRCRHCSRRHHTLLHGKSVIVVSQETGKNQEDLTETPSGKTETVNVKNHFAAGPNQTLLATALIKAESRNGSQLILRALLDQGSQASFISQSAVQLLRLKKIATNTSISGLGNTQGDLTSKAMVMVNIQSLCDPLFKLEVKAHVLNTVTSLLPERKFSLPEWTELGSLQLADPQYNAPNKIDILLGSEVYCAILKEGLIRSPHGKTIAQDTHLGWVLSGQVNGYGDNVKSCHAIVSMHARMEENELLKRFWELESEPSSAKGRILTPEEQACEKHFNATTQRDASGRYVVELPFRSNSEPSFGNTRDIAVKRLKSLEKRLDKNPEQKQNYSEVLHEYLTLGHMEEIVNDNNRTNGKVWLPHHAVIRPDKSTTRTRVVFNASDTSANGISLNSSLMVGPTLQPELRHTLMRWRLHLICLTADIVKMYRQVKIADKHVDYQRIVWRENADDKIRDYRLLTVTFGTSCAPYLAVKALQQVAKDEGHNYPLAARKVITDFYVDDLLTGCQSETEAKRLYEEMNGLLITGGFTLQKWTSNKVGLFDQGKENIGNVELKVDDITKVVGLTWNRRTDEFDYSVKLSSDSPTSVTKREVIAEICRLYDPLGWIAPCIITAKIFIQKLWITGLEWDDQLPDELLREWKLYRQELCKLINFHIPRWVHRTESDVKVELHAFGDASTFAYAAAVYIRCIASDGTINTHLVTAKTKVTPIKQVSIPRLELCGAVLAAKLLLEVGEVLNIDKSHLHAWTDSSVVLAWLSDHPSRWKTFVANRTSEILTLLDSSQWSYVQSKDNPADCASRGILPSELINNKLWKCGPEWLQTDNIKYGKPESIHKKTDLEAKAMNVHTSTVDSDPATNILTRFSSLRKLLRVVAYCRRFLRLKRPRTERETVLSYLTASELQDALTCCIRQHQQHSFHDEISSLLKHKRINKQSKISTLNPYIDEKGILRVGGRIENSDLPDSSKRPIIINGDSYLAKLIVADAHERTLHVDSSCHVTMFGRSIGLLN